MEEVEDECFEDEEGAALVLRLVLVEDVVEDGGRGLEVVLVLLLVVVVVVGSGVQ